MSSLSRRAFLASLPAAALAGGLPLSSDPRERFGATHVGGVYAFGKEPFLVEGARRLLELGTRAGKFWFTPHQPARGYRWNHEWPKCHTLVDLARTAAYRAVFDLPFRVIALEAQLPFDDGEWRKPGLEERLPAHRDAFRDLARHLYATYGERDITFILQNWEGDWLLRGRAGELWNPPPPDAAALCARMAAWMAARQEGVALARAEFPTARCRVLNAIEVNRVVDGAVGIPTVTRDVLPKVEVDLVSYSAYDALASPQALAESLREIRRHARTGAGPLGEGALMLGEIGIPENDQPRDIRARWDGFTRVALDLNVLWTFVWELYCNEPRPGVDTRQPVTRAEDVRGFYLVKPDGTLSETGSYFRERWAGRAPAP